MDRTPLVLPRQLYHGRTEPVSTSIGLLPATPSYGALA